MVNYLENFDFESFICQNNQDIETIPSEENPKVKKIDKNTYTNFSNECCPDQVVGKMDGGKLTEEERQDIDYTFENGKYLARKNVILKNGKNKTRKLEKPVVIILESPHRDEFEYDKSKEPYEAISAKGPAMGKTGKRFFEKFLELVKKSEIYRKIETGTHDIVFMNSIQYQCSLGQRLSISKKDDEDTRKKIKKNQKQRDDIWISCFKGENSCDIEKRLQAIKPFVTINLCTKGKGSGKVTLQEMLQIKICCMNNHTWGPHPSSPWWSNEKAKIE